MAQATRVMITGVNGLLGIALCRVFQNNEVIPLTHADIEITNLDSVKQVLNNYQPGVVLNAAAFTNVDDCEADKDKAFQVNAIGARNLAVACQESETKLVHFSTNYVFGGEPESLSIPFTEFDTPVPVNIYGKSKLAGEELVQQFCLKHFMVRTSGLFGIAGTSGKGINFLDTMIRLSQERDELNVVNDQFLSFTYNADLAEKIAELIKTEYYGVFHITNKGSCSWYEFAREILSLYGSKTPVTPITSDEYPQKAKRPNFSVLDNYHLRLLKIDELRPWQEALKDYLANKGIL